MESSGSERIGPYQLGRKLGSGGMGTVYLARHVETGNVVALKMLAPSLAREEGFVERFNREIRSLEQLANRHVVRLLDSGVDQETYYYAMEYVEGETLTQRLRRVKRLPWTEAVDIALQICSALKAAHDAGIIHRDLKPSNLLIDDNDHVKLTDFGVAQLFAAGKLTSTGGIIGTAEYMSPEQAQGQRVTKRSDLYSLGTVMYTMLTGRPPFTGKSTLDVIHKQQYGQYDKPSRYVDNLPRWLEDVVCRLLEKDPEKRYPDAYVLSLRLQEVQTKFELSQQDETREAHYGGVAASDPTANPTLTVDPNLKAKRREEAVGGTFVRDLVKAEIENSQRKGKLGRLLDNTWVLLGLLAVLVVGGVAWFRAGPIRTTDEPAPLAARQTETDARTQARKLLKNWLDQNPPSETDRLIRQALAHVDTGDLAAAAEILGAIHDLIAGAQSEPLRRLRETVIEPALKAITPALTSGPPILVTDALTRADQLADTDVAAARQIWKSIVLLYADDPRAAVQVETAQTKLAETDPE